MGNWNSGRRPHPSSLKILRGTDRRDRVNPNEPQPPSAAASFDAVPEELQGDTLAAVEWTRVVPMRCACGIVANTDKAILIALCKSWSQYLHADAIVQAMGLLVKGGSDGVPIVNPFLKLARHALAQCQPMWIELGLTPSSRSRLTALTPGPATPSRWGNDL